VSWEDTWIAVDALSRRAAQMALDFAGLTGDHDTVPVLSGSETGHDDVEEIIGVRTGPSGAEALVRWNAAWLKYSSLPKKLRKQASVLIKTRLDERRTEPATSDNVGPPTQQEVAATRIQRSARAMFARTEDALAAQPDTWVLPASLRQPGWPRAVRVAAGEYQFAYLVNGKLGWSSDDTFTARERRYCRSLLKALALPTITPTM
jgi:hypothetical protein